MQDSQNHQVNRRLTLVTRRKVLDCIGNLIAVADEDVNGLVSRWSFLKTYPGSAGSKHTNLHDQVTSAMDTHPIFFSQKMQNESTGLIAAPDEAILALAVDVLHPEVQTDKRRAVSYARIIGEFIREDGFELHQTGKISGHPVFSWSRLRGFHSKPATRLAEPYNLLDDSHLLLDHFNVIERSLRTDPAQAIASSKELVESLLKLILDRSRVSYRKAEDLPDLYRKVATLLNLQAEAVPKNAPASATSQGILRTLVTTVNRLAELRNEIGRGHGRTSLSPAYERHARLAFNAAVTVTEFLIETWNERVAAGKLVIS